jgi:hypothetical protein
LGHTDGRHFVGERITVEFDTPPEFDKLPGCPDRFRSRERQHRVAEVLRQWRDYSPRYSTKGSGGLPKGTWGSGRDYFRVRTDEGRVFEIYYDRKPRGRAERKGSWFLLSEGETPG